MMFSVFKPTRPVSDSEESSSSDQERVLPPGTPYLTKVNGKLVWARQKAPKALNPVQDLLGEAFGTRTTIVRKRSKSLEKPTTKLVMGNIPVVQTQQLTYSTPLPQQGFPGSTPATPLVIQYAPQYPPQTMPQLQHPAQPSRLYIPQQPHQPPPLFVQPSPTEKDFDQLKVVDAHFNKFVKPQPTRLTSASSEDSPDKPQDKPEEKEKEKPKEKPTVKATIAATKHVCAECGGLRSRKYHHDNPLKPGEIPIPAFCRKCQKDASSTSESSTTGDTKKKEKEKTRKKAKPRKPVEISSNDDESSDPPAPEPRKKPKPDQPMKPAAKRVPSEEDIIVEEEFSDHEQQPRGRARNRSTVSEENETLRRALSPLSSQNSRPRSRSRSTVRHGRHTSPTKATHPVKSRQVLKETMRHRSPSIPSRYIEVVPSYTSFESHEIPYRRKVPIHFVDEVIYEMPSSPPKHYRHRESLLGMAPSSKAYSVEGPVESAIEGHHSRDHIFEVREVSTCGHSSRDHSFEGHEPPLRGPPPRYQSFKDRESSNRAPMSKEHSFDERESVDFMQSSEARRRRRRERAPLGSLVGQPWEEPHVFHPRSEDEVVVVTETFEYRPKKQAHDEEERRRQGYIDRATLSPRKTQQFSAEEAEKYYQDDWSRAQPVERPVQSITRKPYRGYRRGRHSDSELTESEATYESAGRHPPPRVPTPPSPISQSKVDEWKDQPPYPLSSDSKAIHRRQNERQGKILHMAPVQIPRTHHRNSSRASSSHAWEAADGRMDTAMILSPRHSVEHDRNAYDEVSGSDLTQWRQRNRYDEVSVSNLTELERQAEAEAEVARHVTFRNTPSLRSMHETWQESELNSQRSRSESGGGGWDDSGGHSGAAW